MLDRTDYKVLSDKLWPYLSVRAQGKVSAITLVTNTSTGGGDFSDLTGLLVPAQAPWIATDISSAVSTHAATNHHIRLHAIFDTLDHTFPAGSTTDVIGYTATNTPGKLTPTSAPGSTEKILKTDVNGFLALRQLTVSEKLYVGNSYFFNDSNYLRFEGPEAFYITGNVSNTLIDSSSIYLGDGAGGSTINLRANGFATDNVDLSYPFGRSIIGDVGYAGEAGFKHRAAGLTGYALLALSTGDSILNGLANTYHRIANVDIFNTTTQRVNPAGSMQKDLGDYSRKWRTGFFAELYVETLVAQGVLATIGGRIMVAPTSKLVADIVSTGTTVTLHLEHNSFVVGAYLYMMAAPGGIPQIEAFKVTSGPTGTAGDYSYVCDRNLDGTGGNVWYIGDAIVSLGSALGHGYIELTSTATIHNHFGPTITHYARTGTALWNDVKPVVSSGNLRSFADYTADEFGIAAANDLTLTPVGGMKGFTLDRTLGLRLFNTNLAMYTSGVKLLELNSNGLFLNDASSVAAFAAYIGASPMTWGGISIAKGDVLIGNSASYLWYDQSTATTQFKGNLDIIAASLVSGSGVLTAGGTTLSTSGVSILGELIVGSLGNMPSTHYQSNSAISIRQADNDVLAVIFTEYSTTETAIFFHAMPNSNTHLRSFYGSESISTKEARGTLQAYNTIDYAGIEVAALPSTDVTWPSKSTITHEADLHFFQGSGASAIVGINSAVPLYPLHIGGVSTFTRTDTVVAVQQASGAAISVRNTTDLVEAALITGGAAGYVGTATNHSFSILTNNAVKATFTTGGNFGIANTDVPMPLTVNGAIRTRQISDTRYYLDSVVGSGEAIVYAYDSTGAVYIPLRLNGSELRLNTGTTGTVTSIINASGHLGLRTNTPQGIIHAYDGSGGFLIVSKTAINATAQVLIPNAAGDVVSVSRTTYAVVTSGGGVSTGTIELAPGATNNIYNVGADILNLRVNADGSMDIRRTGGTLTYAATFMVVWR